MDGNGKQAPQQPHQQQQQEGASPSPLAFYQYILRQGELVQNKTKT